MSGALVSHCKTEQTALCWSRLRSMMARTLSTDFELPSVTWTLSALPYLATMRPAMQDMPPPSSRTFLPVNICKLFTTYIERVSSEGHTHMLPVLLKPMRSLAVKERFSCRIDIECELLRVEYTCQSPSVKTGASMPKEVKRRTETSMSVSRSSWSNALARIFQRLRAASLWGGGEVCGGDSGWWSGIRNVGSSCHVIYLMGAPPPVTAYCLLFDR